MNCTITTVVSVILFCGIYLNRVNAVSWYIKTKGVENGKNVELFCNTSEICNDCNRQWHRESDGKLLAFDEAPTDPSKYTSIKYHNGFSLIIKNFTIKDADEIFICTHGFKSYRKRLKTDEDFEYYVLRNDTNYVDKKTSTLHRTMEFNDVHPTFNCSIFPRDVLSIKSVKRNISSQTLSVHVSSTSKENGPNVTSNTLVRMQCLIESTRLDVTMEDNRHFCIEKKTADEPDCGKVFLIITIPIIALLVCVLIGLLYKHIRLKRKHCECAENMLKMVRVSDEDDNLEEQKYDFTSTS